MPDPAPPNATMPESRSGTEEPVGQAPVFNVFADHDIPGLSSVVRNWLLNVFPAGNLYYPSHEALSDLSGLPAGVVGLALNTESIVSETDWASGIDLTARPPIIVSNRIYDANDRAIIESIQNRLNGEADDMQMPTRIEVLPTRKLMEAWKELTFKPPIHCQILKSLERTIEFMSPRSCLSSGRMSQAASKMFNGMVLLWGPPGSGKSSLCRALAQKLAIRFQGDFPEAILVEIDAHSLSSKYFGESARLVQQTFERISGLLNVAHPPLVCVIIDEVESMATSRQDESSVSNEPKDAMRALNALLTAVDRMRDHHSLIVLCTSNLVSAMDKAFLDRFDFKWHVPEPSAAARYEILRRKYMQLLESGMIATPSNSSKPLNAKEVGNILLDATLPPFESLLLYAEDSAYDVARQLERLSKEAEGISGRSLSKLPWTSLNFHSEGKCVNLSQALDALERSIWSESAARAAGQMTTRNSASTRSVYG